MVATLQLISSSPPFLPPLLWSWGEAVKQGVEMAARQAFINPTVTGGGYPTVRFKWLAGFQYSE